MCNARSLDSVLVMRLLNESVKKLKMDRGLFHGSALLNVKSVVLNDNHFCCSALRGNFDGLSHDR